MNERLNNFIGTTCEIKTMQNELLSYAKVARIKEEDKTTLEILPNSNSDILPLVKYNTPIKIMLHKDDDFMAVGGTVFISDREYWKISNIIEYNNFERRGYFRVSTAAPGKVHKVIEEEQESYPVQLMDISLSGVLFAADQLYSPLDKLTLHSQIKDDEENPLHLKCKVVAREETINLKYLYKYRCKFEEMEQKDSDRLCNIIFKLERENIKKMKAKKGE